MSENQESVQQNHHLPFQETQSHNDDNFQIYAPDSQTIEHKNKNKSKKSQAGIVLVMLGDQKQTKHTIKNNNKPQQKEKHRTNNSQINFNHSNHLQRHNRFSSVRNNSTKTHKQQAKKQQLTHNNHNNLQDHHQHQLIQIDIPSDQQEKQQNSNHRKNQHIKHEKKHSHLQIKQQDSNNLGQTLRLSQLSQTKRNRIKKLPQIKYGNVDSSQKLNQQISVNLNQKQDFNSRQMKRKSQKKQKINQQKNNQNNFQSSNIVLQKKIEQTMSSIQVLQSYRQSSGLIEFCKQIISKDNIFISNIVRRKQCCSSFYHPQYIMVNRFNKFYINSKKQFGNINSLYNITTSPHVYSSKTLSHLGYLQGNFTGSMYNLYHSNEDKKQIICTICYATQFSCFMGYRKIQVYLINSQINNLSQDKFSSLKQQYESQQNKLTHRVIKLITKPPEWRQSYYALNLKSKANISINPLASIKNMALINQQKPNDYKLMFCKIQNDKYYLEATNPFSPQIAMAVILTCFDFKICSQ